MATLLFKAREAKAKVAPEGVDQAVWDMLTTLIASVDQLVISVDALVRTMGGPTTGEDPFENVTRFITGQIICTTQNQGFQLPSFPIPKNKQLVVKALPSNVGWIYLSVTQGQSQSLDVAYMLVPNEGIGLFIKDSDRVWVNAPLAPIGALNDGVTFIVEQE